MDEFRETAVDGLGVLLFIVCAPVFFPLWLLGKAAHWVDDQVHGGSSE